MVFWQTGMLGLDTGQGEIHTERSQRGARGLDKEKGFPVPFDCISVNFVYCMHIPAQLMDLVKTSFAQLYISPPQLCHTLNSSVRHAGLSGRLLWGRIRLHKLYSIFFYNPSPSMHLPSQATASALTVHTAVKFCVSPCFMVACSCSHSRLSLFASLAFRYPLHLCIFSKPIALFDGAARCHLHLDAGSVSVCKDLLGGCFEFGNLMKCFSSCMSIDTACKVCSDFHQELLQHLPA